MATSAAACAYDLANPKIGSTVHVILDALAGQRWPLSAPATLWLAIGAVGLVMGLRGVRAARRLCEQSPGHGDGVTPGHQHGLTPAHHDGLTDAVAGQAASAERLPAGQAASAERLPAGHAVRHADARGGATRNSPSTSVAVTAAHEPTPQ